jgi:FAS-associated factor 2
MQNTSFLGLSASIISHVFAFPFHLLSNILRFIFGVLRIPFPRLTSFSLFRSLPRNLGTGSGSPERWVRELEEETGAVCVSRSRAGTAYAQSSAMEPGPSSRGLTTRAREHGEEIGKMLPDFHMGSYEAFLKACQKEARIGCVVLVSEEHDDVAEFKRFTFTKSPSLWR